MSQGSIAVEFGLGTAILIDELRVRWPCGREESYNGVTINEFFLVQEGNSTVVPE